MFALVALAISFTVSFFLMPVVIKSFKAIDLLDIPDRRKIHKTNAPSLGGLAFFIGFILALFTALDGSEFTDLKYFIASIIMIFLLGVRDDIASLGATQKFSVQILASLIVVFVSDVHFTGLYGLFGINVLPFHLEFVLTIVFIIGLTNAFNLIDGIDGLAGSIGALASVCLGWCFLILGLNGYSIIAFSLSGALISFLFFNWFPSKIFMGDTGSMIIGFIVSVLSIAVINASSLSLELPLDESLPLIGAVLVVPLYDTIKVFVLRLSKGQSPFYPDRSHIHHSLLKIGMNHGQATLILLFFTLFQIWVAYTFSMSFGMNLIIPILIIDVILFGLVIDRLVIKKKFMGSNVVVNNSPEISESKRGS
jgi:UDP-N-acetylmuramyl pentapeptide phosphotransferase/UDP-N-acetylglucosamine-1-phosphate transferase